MKKNTSSKKSPAKSTKSPAKLKSITTTLDDFTLQKNLLKRKDNIVEKYVNASEVRYFDYGAYQELYEEVDWLPKVHHYEKVNETVVKVTIEWVDGVLLDDLYNDKNINTPSDFKNLHYYEVMNMFLEMLAFSRKKTDHAVFFHTGITPHNIIKTPDERLVLIDPDEFQWGDKTNFVTNIISKYSRWLFKILENDDK